MRSANPDTIFDRISRNHEIFSVIQDINQRTLNQDSDTVDSCFRRTDRPGHDCAAMNQFFLICGSFLLIN
ncbi:MAG: hypothetical protein B6245_04300 [Desulfobacteraceae bacterium 4572_88]|nr:MAG: hypothetical protein B6245_04300 [Desulfobacteraceae bacterium 4572_88]